MLRRTKIVATPGPATDDPRVLDQMIEARLDVVRPNFPHESAEERRMLAETPSNSSRAYGRHKGGGANP